MRSDFGQRRNLDPVNEGDELDVRIEAVGEKGDGIAKIKGFVLFVPNTKEGDEVRVRITNVLRKVGFAEVVGQAEGKTEEEPVAEEAATEEPKEQAELAPEKKEEKPAEDSETFGE